MPTHKSILRDLKRAYYRLDDARALIEEVQNDIRTVAEDAAGSEPTETSFELLDIFDQLDTLADEWLGVIYPLGEDIQDWCGRDED